MRFTDILRTAFMNLWRRKLRAVLTVLGMVIGVSSIVVMMSLGIGIVADTGHLPRNLQTRRAACDLEAVVLDLLGDVEGRKSTNRRQLVAKVLVQRLKVVGKLHNGLACSIQDDVAVVDVHHIRRLDEGVAQGAVLGIERVINGE